MADIASIKNQNRLQQPYTIKKEVYAALSPLDQIAARALERCGKVRIVENSDGEVAG